MIKEGNGLGITGFILGLCSLVLFLVFFITPLLAVLGIIFSALQIRRKSNGLAIAGLVLSILGLLVSFFFIAAIIFAFMYGFNDFSVDKVNQTVVLITNDYEYLDEGKIYFSKSGGSGVIYYSQEGKLRVITNKHVIDCTGSEDCGQITKQRLTIRTYDGKIHNVSKTYVAPNGLDLTVLEANSNQNYSSASISKELDKSKSVVAIGYPSFSSNAVGFSISFGSITGTRNLITPEGSEFEVIDSSAYISFGSSGGGLFDESGELVGITTWVDTSSSYSYAINIKHLGDIDSYLVCDDSQYYFSNTCLPLCEGVIDKNYACILPCEGFYCNSEEIYANDNRCADKSLVLGKDGLCHEACGKTDLYCSGQFDYCFQNKCIFCPTGYRLYKDGKCYN